MKSGTSSVSWAVEMIYLAVVDTVSAYHPQTRLMELESDKAQVDKKRPVVNCSLVSLTIHVASASAQSSNNFSSKILSENWNGIFCSCGEEVKFVGLELEVV